MYASSASGAAPACVHSAARTASAAPAPLAQTQRPKASGGRRSWGHALQKADQKKRWQQLLEHLPENMRQIWHALGGRELGRLDDLWRLLDTIDRRTIEDGPLDDTVLWALLENGWGKDLRWGVDQVAPAVRTGATAAHIACQRAGAEPPTLAELKAYLTTTAMT